MSINFPSMEMILSIRKTIPSSNVIVLSYSSHFFITPVMVTYLPPAFMSSGTKQTIVNRLFSTRFSIAQARCAESFFCSSDERLLPRSGLPCGLSYRLVMAGQGGEGRELGGTVYHRHRLPGLGNVVRQVDDVVISTSNAIYFFNNRIQYLIIPFTIPITIAWMIKSIRMSW